MTTLPLSVIVCRLDTTPATVLVYLAWSDDVADSYRFFAERSFTVEELTRAARELPAYLHAALADAAHRSAAGGADRRPDMGYALERVDWSAVAKRVMDAGGVGDTSSSAATLGE